MGLRSLEVGAALAESLPGMRSSPIVTGQDARPVDGGCRDGVDTGTSTTTDPRSPVTASARRELADFLGSRRRQLAPAAVGLPAGTNRRTPGLRREEVALLAGVSHTWYTWLEQGRDIRPSRQVIDALARTLQLSAAERGYVLRLSGNDPVAAVEAPDAMPEHLPGLMDALGSSPAYAITSSWSIVGWNRAYERLYPGVADLAPGDRNL